MLRRTMAALLLPVGLAAQSTLDLRPTCRTCRIEIREELAFQSEWANGGLPTRPWTLIPFARTQWLVVDDDAKLVLRFDERGRYVGPLARRGGGPGEIASPQMLTDWGGDSVAVFDLVNARVNIYAPSGRLARTQRWEGWMMTPRPMRTPDGSLVVAGPIGRRDGFGMPFHEFDRSGKRLRSFGAPTNVQVTRESEVPYYRIPSATAADGSFWAIEATRPVLRRFTLGGESSVEWLLSAKAFDRFTNRGPGGAARGAEFMTIEPVEGGLWLVGLMVPDSRSAEAVGAPKVVDGMRATAVDDWGRYVNTQFLLLDPLRREVLATVEEDAYVPASLGGGRYWGIRPGGDGGRLVVLRAVITR